MLPVKMKFLNLEWLRLLSNSNCISLLKQFSFPKHQSKFTVSVEGNIGSGKSTLMEYFKNSPLVENIPEPIESWKDINGFNALELLYQDPKRWSFSFNNYAFLTRLHMHKKKTRKPVKIMERSLHSTRYCFIENSLRDGTLADVEYAVLCEWFDWVVANENVKVDLFVYLRASPEKCYKRLQNRNRREESPVPYKFIKDLHDVHEEWLVNKTLAPLQAPVLVLDADLELPQMKGIYEQNRRSILCGYN